MAHRNKLFEKILNTRQNTLHNPLSYFSAWHIFPSNIFMILFFVSVTLMIYKMYDKSSLRSISYFVLQQENSLVYFADWLRIWEWHLTSESRNRLEGLALTNRFCHYFDEVHHGKYFLCFELLLKRTKLPCNCNKDV